MLSIPMSLAKASDHPVLADKTSRYGDTVDLNSIDLTPEMLDAVVAAGAVVAESPTSTKSDVADAKRIVRVVEAIIAARAGDTAKAVPSLPALPEMLLAYLRANLTDGWVYKRGADGHLHAWLVTGVKYDAGDVARQQRPSVSVSLTANGAAGDRGAKALALTTKSLHFSGEDVVRKRIADVLTNAGVYIETPALREEYNQGLAHYTEVLTTGFAEQFRFRGKALSADYRVDGDRTDGAKVIHDLRADEVVAPGAYSDSVLFMDPTKDEGRKSGTEAPAPADGEDYPGVGPVPIHFALRVFDLGSHDFYWVNTTDCTRYVYDPTLREKLVLPEDQRNLLDILTTNLDDFTSDVIEGKSAGNVVLCKGMPGVGKTLTAEVYSELIERPLYSIHSGNLGTDAADVRSNLETTFKRIKRWNAVLLLDEADVFVLERGGNIVQNAIVAEFLRTLEYFTGLMFMTTNRADNIDDAILSRAAAIIDYPLPDREGIAEVWRVQATNNGVTLDEGLLDDLVGGFARIAPRDVKMLLRLALRVAKGNGNPLDVATFARCAMFRGLHFEKGSRA